MKTVGTIDIETYPGTYRTFADNMYEVSLLREVSPVIISAFTYKPLGKKSYTRGHWQYPNYKEFIRDLHRIHQENDYLIGHNAKKFDLRHCQTFFAKYGFSKTNTKIFDTKNIVKNNWKLPSYSLKYILVYFGIGKKLETGGDILWQLTEEGDAKARKKFLNYCENDGIETEKLFKFLVAGGWVPHLPWEKIFKLGDKCPRCKVVLTRDKVQSRGLKAREEGRVHEFACKNCNKRLYTDVVAPWKE